MTFGGGCLGAQTALHPVRQRQAVYGRQPNAAPRYCRIVSSSFSSAEASLNLTSPRLSRYTWSAMPSAFVRYCSMTNQSDTRASELDNVFEQLLDDHGS